MLAQAAAHGPGAVSTQLPGLLLATRAWFYCCRLIATSPDTRNG